MTEDPEELVARIIDQAEFLCDRLGDLEWADDGYADTLRDYMGHVDPAHSRLKSSIEEYRSRLTADRERSVGEWQPIETAPKDGTDILAWVVHPNAEYAGTPAERSDWQTAVVTRWIEHNGGGWTWYGLTGRFTHWMPLPAAPAPAIPETGVRNG